MCSPSFDDVSRVVVGSLSTTFDTSASVSFPHGWSSESDLNLYCGSTRPACVISKRNCTDMNMS